MPREENKNKERENKENRENKAGERENKNKGKDRRVSIKDAFNRFFEDDFWIEPFDLLRSPRRLVSRMGRPELFPRIDINETDKEVRVIADVPGVDPEDIDIQIEGNHMKITGRIDRESETKDGERPYRYERAYGEFRREFVLPAHVKEDEIKAACKDGVLTITLPKVEGEKRKKIKIEKQ